jgi:hypothetical protein
MRVSCAENSSNRKKIVEIFRCGVPKRKRSEITREGNALLPGCFRNGLKFGESKR